MHRFYMLCFFFLLRYFFISFPSFLWSIRLFRRVINHALSLSCIWFFVTRWMVAHQALLSMGLSIKNTEVGYHFPSPGDLPNPGIEPMSPVSPAPAGGFFTIWAIKWGIGLNQLHKLCEKASCSVVSDSLQHFATRQALLSKEFSRREYWSR